MIEPYYQDANVTLFHGDCLTILPTLEAGSVDAVVTDPPYGIGENSRKVASRENLAKPKDYGNFDWDRQPCSPAAIELMRKTSTVQIIWGGNFFSLPPSSCWLVWDKLNGANDFADAELAWTNLKKATRVFRWLWNGMIRKGNEERFHPTQKPLQLMHWCLSFLPDSQTILDPFMGSGTTGVACVQTGRRFIGIEIDEGYCKIAKKRIIDAKAQGRLGL